MNSWIKLTVAKKLDAQNRKLWYKCVQQNTPSGLLHHTQLPDQHDVKSTSYYHKSLPSGAQTYVIPLVRDLVHHEVYKISHAWDACFPHTDFVIDYSQPADHTVPITHADIPEHKIAQVMDAWCKAQHNTWMQDKLDKGWSYGTHLSVKNKTHPWLQPWESLPPQAQSPHMQAVKDLLKILTEFGYSIKQKLDA
jgi:hypothetical protein